MVAGGSQAREFRVVESLDIFDVRRVARSLAADCGFSRIDGEELVIVVSELASNIVKYGKRGTISLSQVVAADGRRGVRVVARDIGEVIDVLTGRAPRRADTEPLFIGRGGIGGGLDAIKRLTDSFEYTRDGERNQITVERYPRARWR